MSKTINMSRSKRWLNMNGKEFNSDGTLKPEARKQMLGQGMTDGAIDSYARRSKQEFEEWKHLDQTSPEPWPIYTAFDFFTDEEKQQFNPDGSLKPEYRESELACGTNENWLDEMERRKKLEVDDYNIMSKEHEQQGINYGAWLMRSHVNTKKNYIQRRRQMEIDLRNCEERSTLPFDIDTPWL
jgi:hypothetical protein